MSIEPIWGIPPDLIRGPEADVIPHAGEVAKVGGIVERMPVAHLDGRDANGQGRLPVICSGSWDIVSRRESLVQSEQVI